MSAFSTIANVKQTKAGPLDETIKPLVDYWNRETEVVLKSKKMLIELVTREIHARPGGGMIPANVDAFIENADGSGRHTQQLIPDTENYRTSPIPMLAKDGNTWATFNDIETALLNHFPRFSNLGEHTLEHLVTLRNTLVESLPGENMKVVHDKLFSSIRLRF